MPSYVIHLSCAKRILELAGGMLTKQDENLFYLGNMIADMCKDKRTTHFWDDETYPLLARRPNLSLFMEKYGAYMQEPYVRGYYAHLFLDRMFLDTYWEKHFRFYGVDKNPEKRYTEVAYVEIVEKNKVYDRKEFFSKALYYGDYDAMNGYFAEKYQVRFPELSLSGDAWMHVHRIREIDWTYAPEAVANAKKLLASGIRRKMGEIEAELRVFELPELEAMVEHAAKKLADT